MNMSERFKVTKHDDPSGKAYKNYGATSAESDVELKGKLLSDTGKFIIPTLLVNLVCHKIVIIY